MFVTSLIFVLKSLNKARARLNQSLSSDRILFLTAKLGSSSLGSGNSRFVPSLSSTQKFTRAQASESQTCIATGEHDFLTSSSPFDEHIPTFYLPLQIDFLHDYIFITLLACLLRCLRTRDVTLLSRIGTNCQMALCDELSECGNNSDNSSHCNVILCYCNIFTREPRCAAESTCEYLTCGRYSKAFNENLTSHVFDGQLRSL